MPGGVCSTLRGETFDLTLMGEWVFPWKGRASWVKKRLQGLSDISFLGIISLAF